VFLWIEDNRKTVFLPSISMCGSILMVDWLIAAFGLSHSYPTVIPHISRILFGITVA